VEKMKTIGKLVDEKITPEGLFTIVLKTVVSDNKYAFVTQNNGKDTVKSPEGMFTTYAINNDLKYVDEKIRNYYELGEFLTDQEIAEIDEEAKRVDIEPPKSKEERKRRKTREEVQEANSTAVANAGTTEDGEPTEFTADSMPVTEEVPRRRRRRTE
jgi:hypothetical protein